MLYDSEIGVSLQLTDSDALRFQNWSFTIKDKFAVEDASGIDL
jgi:hypothetical protein